MSLRTKLANKPIVDENGYASGVLENIIFLDESENDYNYEQFQFCFKVEGTKKPLTINLWTSTKISGEKWENGSGVDYTKLSKIVMKLGLITEEELIKAYQSGKDPEINLETLIGTKVKFKLVKPLKSDKKKRLSKIDLNTIELS